MLRKRTRAAVIVSGIVTVAALSLSAAVTSMAAPARPQPEFASRLQPFAPAAPTAATPEPRLEADASPRRATAVATPVASQTPIALTFDDGPSPGVTEQLLAVLASRGVKATFFVTGASVERAPDVTRAVAGAGHAIGNHSYDHPEMDGLTPEEIAWQITHTNDVIAQVTGVRPAWMRPPYGRRANGVLDAIRGCGMRPAMWTLDPKDWAPTATPAQVTATVLAGARPGGIILLHERAGTVTALPDIIDGLIRAGYRLVTLDEL